MNTEPPSSRWVRELAGQENGPTPAESQVLGEVLRAIRRVRHGTVSIALQDGKVVQLDVTEKRRF